MADSKIDWTDKVWNPTTGCTMGCNYCYAEKMAHRLQLMGQEKYKLGFAPACHPVELGKPLRWKKPARIFINSMGDLFDPAIPFDFIDQIMLVINQCPQHTFQILTKHSERMQEYFQGLATPGTDTETSRRMLQNPSYASGGFHGMRLRYLKGESLRNLWLGVTVTCQEDLHRWWDLWSTPAAIRFISLEPLIGPICFDNGAGKFLDRLDWLIVGGMTGKDASPMHPEWVRNIRDLCQAAAVPFYFKQWGGWSPTDKNYGDVGCWESDRFYYRTHSPSYTGVFMERIKGKSAGNILDGAEWKQLPGEKSQ